MPDSFEDYVTGRGRALLRFAYVLCHDADLAQDLVQDALVKTHARWSRVEAPDAYVRKAIVNDFCSWTRRRKEVVTDTVPEIGEPDPGPEDRDAMWRLLAELPRQQRAVLVLRFYEGLPDDAIGRALGCGEATVRSHASKALATLRASSAGSHFVEGTSR
jgi:RNA polymerase sigma-70 factor (sigma-E family)